MRLLKVISAALVFSLLTSCAHNNKKDGENINALFQHDDPAINAFLDRSVAYVVYPEVGKGAIGIGGAYGEGKVFEKGLLGYGLVGYSELTQVSAGLQLGGQTYTEAIFFENEEAFKRFKRGEFQLSAHASAVFGHKGQKLDVTFDDGVAIVIRNKDGVMGELAVGGQKLSFKPL